MTFDRETTLDRLRAVCFALPEVTERLSHSAPSFFVREKKTLCSAWLDGHHGDDRPVVILVILII